MSLTGKCKIAALLRANLDAISRKRRFRMSAEVKKKPATISRATVERLLAVERKKRKPKGRSAAKKGAPLKNQMPARVFWARDEKLPGFCGIGTVSHDGGGGIPPYYAWAVTVTDAAPGWAEVRALKNKARRRTLEAAIRMPPFPPPYAALTATGAASSSTSILRNEDPVIQMTTAS